MADVSIFPDDDPPKKRSFFGSAATHDTPWGNAPNFPMGRPAPRPGWTPGQASGLTEDPRHVGQAPPPPMGPEELGLGIKITDSTEKVSWDMPEELKADKVPPITRGLWYASRFHAEIAGRGERYANDAFEMLRYMMEPPQTNEERAAYAAWAVDMEAGWDEMPKGALGVELPADLAGTVPGIFLGARDIAKDYNNDDMSWVNIFDVAGMIPLFGFMTTGARILRHGESAASAVKRLGKVAARADNVRLVRVARQPGPTGPTGRRSGTYIFDTPSGQVEVEVAAPGTHGIAGLREDPHVRGTGTWPKEVEYAMPEDVVWASVKHETAPGYVEGFEDVVGTGDLREIYRQISDLFPDAKFVGGERVTGSATKTGVAASGQFGGGGGNLFIYVGNREKLNNVGAVRQLLLLSETEPEVFARVVENMARDGQDVSVAALRRREADFLLHGLPDELNPAKLPEIERELKRIESRADYTGEDAEEAMLDYLDALGIEARDHTSGGPTELAGHMLHATLDPRAPPLSEVLNPAKVTPEEFDVAWGRAGDAGIDPSTGRTTEQVAEETRRANIPDSIDAEDRVTTLLTEWPNMDWDTMLHRLRNLGYEETDATLAMRSMGMEEATGMGEVPRQVGDYPDELEPPRPPPQGPPNHAHTLLDPELPDDRHINVYRRSQDPRASIDPESPHMRTGREGEESARRANYGDDYPARTPYYIKGQNPEPEFEHFPIQIEARIPERRVYDIHADPKGYMARLELEPGHPDRLDNLTEVEMLVAADPDYSAMMNTQTGQIWAFEELQEVHRRNLETGEWMDNAGSHLNRDQSPLQARGIRHPSEGGEPIRNALDITNVRERSAIRQGQAGTDVQRRWPQLTRAEYGGPLRRLLGNDRGEVVKGGRNNPDRIVGARVWDPVTDKEYIAPNHGMAAADMEADLLAQGMDPELVKTKMAQIHRTQTGRTAYFKTEQGLVLDRDEALTFAENAGQNPRAPQPGMGDRLMSENVPELREAAAAREAEAAADAAAFERLRVGPSGRGAEAFGKVEGPPNVTPWDIEMAEKLNAGNGVSVGLDGQPLPRRLRWVVSPDKNTETIFASVTPEDVATFRTAHAGALSAKGAVFGAWVDDGKIYMDVSRGFSTKRKALDVARAGDQMAIADRKYLPKHSGGLADIPEPDWDNAFPSTGTFRRGGEDVPYFNEERGVTEWPNERERAETVSRTYDHMPDVGEALDAAMERNMGPQTAEWYANARPHVKKRIKKMYRLMLSDEDLATMMALGQQTKGWYEGAAATIRAAYGEDAPQFMALLAATSPNVPVTSNTRFAQDLFQEWVRWGRPRDPDVIQEMFTSVANGEGYNQLLGHQVVDTAINNVVTVLKHPNPIEYFGDPAIWARGNVLSGKKVDPFFANVSGEMRRMTVDTHEFRYAPIQRLSDSRRVAFEAGFTGAADELSRALEMPEALKVAHAQEISWEPMRQLGEMAGRGRRRVEDILFNADGTLNMATLEELDVRMKEAQDFGQIMGTEEGRMMVGQAGGDPEFEITHRTGLTEEQAAAARQRVLDNPEALRRASRRADMGYAGESMFSALPWLAAGGAGAMGKHLQNVREAQEGEPPSLFQPPPNRGFFQ